MVIHGLWLYKLKNLHEDSAELFGRDSDVSGLVSEW
jgi:hypothetical protein